MAHISEAFPYFFFICCAVIELKKSLITSQPFCFASNVIFLAGSTPMALIPKSLKGFKRSYDIDLKIIIKVLSNIKNEEGDFLTSIINHNLFI